jgi:hypothetical protein
VVGVMQARGRLGVGGEGGEAVQGGVVCRRGALGYAGGGLVRGSWGRVDGSVVGAMCAHCAGGVARAQPVVFQAHEPG